MTLTRRECWDFPGWSVHAIDKPGFRMYDMCNFIYDSSAACFASELAENRKSGQNPERYRHCMRGGARRTKVSHWKKF